MIYEKKFTTAAYFCSFIQTTTRDVKEFEELRYDAQNGSIMWQKMY
jgi:hypothetical protein